MHKRTQGDREGSAHFVLKSSPSTGTKESCGRASREGPAPAPLPPATGARGRGLACASAARPWFGPTARAPRLVPLRVRVPGAGGPSARARAEVAGV